VEAAGGAGRGEAVGGADVAGGDDAAGRGGALVGGGVAVDGGVLVGPAATRGGVVVAGVVMVDGGGAAVAGRGAVVVGGVVTAGPPAASRPLVPGWLSIVAPGVLPVAEAVPRAGEGGNAPGLERLGRDGADSDGRDWTVFSDPPHGTSRNRLRGRSPPNQLATDGPTRSARASTTPTPSAIRNQRTLKMLGWRRIRWDTSVLTRLILEFPKYGRMLAGQC
jgi:hypothetical protein